MKKFPTVLLILALAGIFVSVYLVYYHYQARAGAKGWCDITKGVSCDAVLLSDYAEIAGIPLGVFGAVWFAVVVLIYYSNRINFLKKSPGENMPFYLFAWALVGLISIVWLVYAEIFLIGSVCILCTIAHALGIAVLVIAYTSLEKSISTYLRDIFYE